MFTVNSFTDIAIESKTKKMVLRRFELLFYFISTFNKNI